jgi:hypothetical protein
VLVAETEALVPTDRENILRVGSMSVPSEGFADAVASLLIAAHHGAAEEFTHALAQAESAAG